MARPTKLEETLADVDFTRPRLMPASTPDFMAPAWAGCLRWAVGKQEILDAFAHETGNQWKPGRSGLDRMIDEATGADRKFFEAFVAWFNVNVWGEVDGPEDSDDGDGEE